ncbi:MAG: CotH kinase family protein [Phycisphaerae bacterium]|nr:CotH kinase family protein [Phycisphaerae bacterium]
MRRNRVIESGTAIVLALAAGSAQAQDLYDTTVLRTLNFTFVEPNWETILRNNYVSQTNLLGSLTVDGVTYPNVGVRIRGNTSYTALPAGSQKFSLNVEMDAVDPNQSLLGYDSLNLNNAFRDPTFCREVVYNNYVAQFIAHPRSNHVVVTINGQNWGVYANVQQFNKKMLSVRFPDTSGLRIKCANNPNGPGLRYNGATAAGYTGYEIKDPGGFADPWAPHILVCNTVTNAALTNWQATIDPIFAVDPSTWSIVFENILTDDDSYVNKGADFMTYRNPTDGRTFLLQTDANETFTAATWAVTRNWTSLNRPVMNRVFSVPELRQRHMAHYRTAKQDLNWAYFGPIFEAHRALIDAAVQADPKKLYSYALFQQNFTSTVTLPYGGLAGGTVIGLQQFFTDRNATLNATAELVAAGPTISNVGHAPASPDPAQAVTISASVAPPAGSSVGSVQLYYRPSPGSIYQRVEMTNNGSGTYSVVLPITAQSGQRVPYYVAATATNSFASMSFSPAHTEWNPRFVDYTFGATGGMRITEWMYSGTSGEFVEFTNISAAPIDMTGWSFDDDHASPGAFDLSAFGIVQPGESVVLTEASAAAFRTAWNLSAAVKVIGNLGAVGVGGNNLARNDIIHLYDSTNQLVDRLRYGDQTYPGTIRTQNISGQTCRESVGQDTVGAWVLSAVGDPYGSYTSAAGERGSPGVFVSPSCFPCYANCDGSTTAPVLNVNDFICFQNKFAAGDSSANCDGSTTAPVLNVNDFTCFLNAFAAGCG